MSRASPSLSWREDLKLARNVSDAKRSGFEMLLSWLENWRIGLQLESGREAARTFWVQQVKSKPRADWQLEQWGEALAWEVQYGRGLRLKELTRLRVKDVDLERRQITIRQGKGDLDRVTVLPEALVEKMRGHLVEVRPAGSTWGVVHWRWPKSGILGYAAWSLLIDALWGGCVRELMRMAAKPRWGRMRTRVSAFLLVAPRGRSELVACGVDCESKKIMVRKIL